MSPYLEKSDWWLHANTMTDGMSRRISSYETHRKLFIEWVSLWYVFLGLVSQSFPQG